ncbi:hypothetical protein F9K85_05060 [Brucella tritici]|nr:hypothetical protein F9K85_05060 [Brucella tritici]
MVTLARMKDVGLRIRIQRELRDAFLAACRNEDKAAAQVLREFMRDYVRQHQQADGEANHGRAGAEPKGQGGRLTNG